MCLCSLDSWPLLRAGVEASVCGVDSWRPGFEAVIAKSGCSLETSPPRKAGGAVSRLVWLIKTENTKELT